MEFRLTQHVRQEMLRRGISEKILEDVLKSPQQKQTANQGRMAYQSKIKFADGRLCLVRAIVDENDSPYTVVTVYRTSKIDKYWRKEK